MIGTTGFSSYSRLLSKGFVGALIMATGLSCSDGSTAPASGLAGDLASGAAKSVVFQHSFAEKSAAADAVALSAAPSPTAPSSIQAFGGSRVSSVVAAPMYSVFPVAYAPETGTMTKIGGADDQVTFVSMGFLFNFYGNNYNIIYISSNGFVGFRNTIGDGYKGGSIPNAADAPYNNLIALAWTDLDPSAAGASYSYATLGTAPNRKFVVQWTNVPEYDLAADPTRQKTPGSPLGHLTGQIVLSEGSNDITMYTSSLDISSSFHPVTQGIENFGGDEAAFLPGRVQAHYSVPLMNDGVRFSLSHVNQPPVVVAPANIAVNADAGLCSAVVNPGTPTVKDDAAGWSVAGARSDALALDAAYPARVTSITWTATDAGGLKGAAAQTVTVKDAQAPTINAPEGVSVNADRGLGTATVALNAPAASDNCGNVTVVGSRSDAQPMSTGFPVGVTTVVWKATDAAGNSASASQTVTVSGNQPPTISAPDLSMSTDSSLCSAKFEPKPNVSDDNPNGLVVVGARSDKLAVNLPYPKGLTTITWTVTDAGGLTASAVQKVTVSDKEKPSIAQPANKSVGAHAAAASVAVENPAADDNCKIVSVKGQRNDGADLSAPYPVGTTVITWSAVDPSLNLRTATQSVTVMDESAPVFDVMPAMTVNATMPSGAVVSFAPHATDNVGVVGPLVCSLASGSVFPIGQSTVNCVAKDAAGNEGHVSFVVTVLGAHDQIGNLMAKVTALNLEPGVANPMLNQLQTAYRNPGNGDSHVACVKMGDFLNMLLGTRGNFPMQKSNAVLADDARRIMAVMGC
jgi:HYR domain-containing protein